jgi:phosphate transport system protein
MPGKAVLAAVGRWWSVRAALRGCPRRAPLALQVSADLARMGDLAVHVAETALRRFPDAAVPPQLAPMINEVAQAADRLAGKLVRVLGTWDARRAAELERDDDAMDQLHRRLLALILDPARQYGVEHAIDGALLGRWYERFADQRRHAGHQMVYLVTGQRHPHRGSETRVCFRDALG